jgi:hypothetical protein
MSLTSGDRYTKVKMPTFPKAREEWSTVKG